MTKELFRIGDQSYSQYDFVKYLRMSQGRTPERSVKKYVDDKYELFKTTSLLDYEDERLEGKYPEFKALMKEYRDGILLFELTDDMVWTKAVKDTTGLKEYYADHAEEFMYGDRLQGTVYKAKDVATAEKVIAMLGEGKSNIEIEQETNSDSQLDLTIQSDTYEMDEDEITGQIEAKLGLSEIQMIDGQAVFMDVKELIAPAQKPFDKIKGLVTAAYQNQLEKEWIEELRARYTVVLNKDVLYSVK